MMISSLIKKLLKIDYPNKSELSALPILYRTFYMNEFEFALPSSHFRGIMNVTDPNESYAQMNQRKIPLIDLNRMLNIYSENVAPYCKIIVLEIDNIYFGIFCHREGHSTPTKDLTYAPIVSMQSLLTLVQRIEKQKTLITFTLDKIYAIDVEDIHEIIPYPETINTSKSLPTILKGFFYINGEPVYIVDTGQFCNSKRESCLRSKELLITRKDHLPYAFMIDAFEFFVSPPNDKWIKFHRDDMKENTQKVFVQSQQGEGQILHLLNLDTLTNRICKK